jgi:hypothetical protein
MPCCEEKHPKDVDDEKAFLLLPCLHPRPFLAHTLFDDGKKKFMSLEKAFTHRNQESSDFGESIGDAGVSFCGRCECLYLDVKIL